MDGIYQLPVHDAHRREKKRAIKTFSRCYFALLLFLVFVELAALLFQVACLLLFGPGRTIRILSDPYVQYGLQVIIMYIMGFPLFLLLNLGLSRTVYEKKKLGVGEFFVYLLISIFIMQAGAIISTFISDVVSAFLPSSGSGSGVVGSLISGVPVWLVIAVAVIIGPIFEELMFRKVLIDRLSVYGDRLAIIVSAAAFGLFHGNIEQLLYATGVGLLFGFVYTKTRRIRYSILLHIFVNFFGTVPAIAMSFIEEKLASLGYSGDIMGNIGYFISYYAITLLQFGMLIAGLVLFIVYIVKGRLIPEDRCEIRIKGATVVRSVILNPGAILFALLCVAEIVLYFILY